MSTLLVDRASVARYIDALSLLQDMRAAFVARAGQASAPAQRARSVLSEEGTALVLFPGTIPGVPAYTVKVHAKFQNEKPAIRGVVHLFDAATGELLAILDSGYLTAIRTGVAGALAADALARKDASRVAIIGAGAQGATQLKSLRLVRSLSHVRVYDLDPFKAEEFAGRMYGALDVPVRPAKSVEDAVGDCDLVVLSTWGRAPVLFPGMVPRGCHVTSLGADEPGKQELAPNLIRQSAFFCDDRALAVSAGAIGSAGLGPEAIRAELGEVLAGQQPGRSSEDEVTLFSAVGLPFQDLAAAWHVYLAAREDEALPRVDLGA